MSSEIRLGYRASTTVIGAGSYGTALAMAFSRNGEPVVLWGRNAERMSAMAAARENASFLAGITFPATLQIENDLALAVSASRDILIVVPSYGFRETIEAIKPLLKADQRVFWATKGLEPQTGELLQTVVREILGDSIPLAILSGPTFAKELALGMPTAIAVAATDDEFAHEIQQRISCDKSFRVYVNPDMIGLQLGGAVKNVIAIAAGISDGMGFGANARTALITRGLSEMSRLGEAMGAQSATFTGLGGLGDLILTCTDNQSRNRRFGMAIGQGKSIDDAIQHVGQLVEGYRNAEEVFQLAQHYQVSMPITENVYQVLYHGLSYDQAAKDLLSRALRQE